MMSEYKRKKVKRPLKRKKTHRSVEKPIEMANKNKPTGIVPEEEIKVIRGKKFKRGRIGKIFAIIASVILIVCVVLSFVLPVSLYENLVNWVSLIGNGSYPISISGSEVISSVSNGSYYYILTDTNIAAYSNNGKIIFDELHGFSNPVMSVSETRALVYDQGGKNVYIYNLGGLLHTLETQNDILSASISRNGDFAVSTHSEKFASTVNVYNKNNKKIYSWNSAYDLIVNVLVDTKGKKLALTTLDVSSAQYDNKFLILEINSDSADPIYTFDLKTSIPYSLANTGKGISLVCNDKYKYISWSDYSTNDIEFSGEINNFKNTKNGFVFTYSLSNNQNDNKVVLISKKGEKISEFNINSSITDIQLSKGRIYFINDSTVTIFDKDGKLLRNGNCNYGVKKFAVLSSNSIAAISDNEITTCDIEKEDD